MEYDVFFFFRLSGRSKCPSTPLLPLLCLFWVSLISKKRHYDGRSGFIHSARILCWSFTPKRHRQLRMKYLPKVHTLWLEGDSNSRPFRQKVVNLPMSHHTP